MIELVGDVGSGKTTFVQGLAEGLGVEAEVTSPTFTLNRAYPARGGKVLYHFDFYRLGGHDLVTEALSEVMADSTAITAIEWAGEGDAQLPEHRLRITFQPTEHEGERSVMIESLGKALDYIVKGVA